MKACALLLADIHAAINYKHLCVVHAHAQLLRPARGAVKKEKVRQVRNCFFGGGESAFVFCYHVFFTPLAAKRPKTQ
jgi:hypothetical protein